MWRSACQASEHYGGDTQRSDVVRFAFDEHQRGGRVFKEQQFTWCLFGHLPLGMSFFLSFFKLDWSLLLRYNNQVKVPSLVRAVRDAGLLIAAYGTAENLANLVSSTQSIDGGGVDAVFQEGVLVFHDHFPRAWS